MAKQTLNNSETGLQIRTKINDNFTELYNQVESVTSVAVDTTLNSAHGTVIVDASGGNKVITLPTASGISGKVYRVQKSEASANTVTITPFGSEKINGDASVVIQYKNSAISVQSNGTNWIII